MMRIVIADKHRLFRACLRRLLETAGGFSIVGEAADAARTVRVVLALEPDVLLLGLPMTPRGGLDVLRALRREDHPSRVMLLPQPTGSTAAAGALRLGARGVLFKESSAAALAEGIRRIVAGDYWIGQSSAPDLARAQRRLSVVSMAAANRFELTTREIEVASAVAVGMSNREIARRLCISEKTVKGHLVHIFDKTGSSNRVELARFASGGRPGPRVSSSRQPAQALHA